MKQKDLLLILGSICVMTVAWIIFNVYHLSVSSTIPDIVATQVKPISSDFDLKTVEELKKRQKVNPNFTLQSLLTPTPTPPPFLLPKKNTISTESSFLR